MTLRLWVIRHGATDWSDEGRFNGWEDVHLNDRGRRQSVALSDQLGERRFAGVWSSDLSRAVQTAELALGGAVPDRRLRELDFGTIEGKTWNECPNEIQRALMEFDSFVAPDGESVEGLVQRVGQFVSNLSAGDHLLFTHGGVIRALGRSLGRETRVAPGEFLELEFGR